MDTTETKTPLLKMNLFRDQDYKEVVKAVENVSGFNDKQLKDKHSRRVTAWVRLGIYVAHDMGMTLEEASSLFKRHYTTGHAAVKKIKALLKVEDPLVTKWVGTLRDHIMELQASRVTAAMAENAERARKNLDA